MDHLLYALILVGVAIPSIASASHALLVKRDPRSAFVWIALSLTCPLVGPLLYWLMGINRISRRARAWMDSGRRLAGWDVFTSGVKREAANELPDGAEHLLELRTLADRVVNAPLMAGNTLTPLTNGEKAYPAMLAAIDAACHSVNLSTYIFDADVSGRRFAESLRRAANRGVEVRVIIDGLGEKYSWPTTRHLLKGSPIKVRNFLPLRQGGYINLRNHRKILITDGKLAFTGGMNISDRHLLERNTPPLPVQDLHFSVEGPVVSDLQRVFLEDWYFVSRELVNDNRLFPLSSPTGPALVRTISDGPDREFRKLHCIIMGALACARKRVRIMTPYFIPDRALVSAMITTAMRGVEVTLILPAVNNLTFVHWATRSFLWEFLKHDIKIFYQPPPFAHTKLFLVDGIWSLIGSANLDPRSLRLNFELNLEAYDQNLTKSLERDFTATMTKSHQITLAEVDGRPLPERIRDGIAKLFSPYL